MCMARRNLKFTCVTYLCAHYVDQETINWDHPPIMGDVTFINLCGRQSDTLLC